MDIGKKIKTLRMERCMTQQELAEKIDVSRSMVAQIERGERCPTIVLGKDIADAFGIDLRELLEL